MSFSFAKRMSWVPISLSGTPLAAKLLYKSLGGQRGLASNRLLGPQSVVIFASSVGGCKVEPVLIVTDDVSAIVPEANCIALCRMQLF